MTWLSDRVVGRLRAAGGAPDLQGTRYRLLETVGRGGMGAVFRVEDTTLGRDVALKVLDAPDPGGDLAGRLLREAHVLARLEHPGIVPVHEVGKLTDGRTFYVMKYVRGERLDGWAAAERSLPERLRVFRKLCEPVAFAHAHGVVHRDLKPQNIMVGPFGEVLVLDWGVAKVVGEDAPTDPSAATEAADTRAAGTGLAGTVPPTAHGAVLGTPGFMAPEQARGDPGRVTERTDVYALGALLEVLLGERAPGDAPTAGMEEAARPRRGPRAPRALVAIVERAKAESPGERYASVQELALEVDRYLDGRPVLAYPESRLVRMGRFLWKHRIAVALLLAYIAVRMAVLASRR